MLSYDFVTGDTKPTLTVECRHKQTGVLIDLTSTTVRLRWKAVDGVTEIERVMTILPPPTSGLVAHQFLGTDLYAPQMSLEVEITDAAGKVTTNPNKLVIRVRDEIG